MVDRSHTISTAAAEIVALINSRAQSPWPQEIEAIIARAIVPEPITSPPLPTLALDIRAKIAQLHAAYAILGKLHDGPEFDAADAVVERLKADLCNLEDMIPKPPRAYADVVTRAELALYWSADTLEDLARHGDGAILADLIEAVLHFAGSDVAKMLVPPPASSAPAGLPPLSPDHLKYREIIAEIARHDANYPFEKTEAESEAAINALSEQARALERKIWATPAKTLADVLLRGEIALHNENSLMDVLESLSRTTTSMPARSSSRPSSAWGGSAMDSIHPECFWHRVLVDDADSWEDWLCDPKAKLSHGCRVVVRMRGDFMIVGTIANKRPVDFRRVVIAFRDVDGCERQTRIFGRKDADTQVARVVGVFTPTAALLHLEAQRQPGKAMPQ